MVLARLFAAVSLVVVLATSAMAGEMRKWSDTSGKFAITAKFIALKDGNVTLQKEDGSQIEIEFRKLSPADQKYVNEQQDDNPFKPKAGTPAPSSGSDFVATTSINWSTVRVVNPSPVSNKWQVPVPASAPASGNHKPVALPPSKDFHESIRGLAIDGPGKRGIVGYTSPFGVKNQGATRLVLCDLEAGKTLGNATMAGTNIPIALSDGGGRVLLKKEERGGGAKHGTLELRSLESPQLPLVAQWQPTVDTDSWTTEVTWASFIDDKRLITVVGTRLVVWNVDPLKPEYQLTILDRSTPALSPDRKLLAFAGNSEYGILDLAKGEVLAMRPLPNKFPPSLAFSPSGAKLACAATFNTEIVYTATGNVLADSKEAPGGFDKLAWVSEEYLLCGTLLIDPIRQVNVWDYPGAATLVPANGTCWAAVSDWGRTKNAALLPLKLPHPAAKETLERTLSDPNYVVLKSGMSVSIDVEGIADADQREPACFALTKKLEANGFKVEANAKVTLVASTEIGEEEDVHYRTFGVPFGGEQTYRVRRYRTVLKFMSEGKQLWYTATSNVPSFVRLKEKETMDSYLRGQEKHDFSIFSTVELPKQLTKPNAGRALGSTQISATGLH